MSKKSPIILIILALTIVLVATLSRLSSEDKPAKTIFDTKYSIDGEILSLVNSTSSPDSVSGTTSLRYFGNELITDLNGDNIQDVVFLATRQTGGSGTFYYVVSAINTGDGYVGSDGYLLGDRIAPQNIVISTNPSHKNVIVANYADRAQNEPMTSAPSVGKSAYLKLNTETMQWGIVVSDFEGESR